MELGFAKALELAPTVVVMLDGDGQHSPEEIPGIVDPIVKSEAEMVIGSRFQGTEINVPVWRQFGQHALTFITNYTSGTKSTDSQSGFRAFSPQILKNFTIRTSGFSIESEMQFWATENGIAVAEIPINCLYEEKSKRNPITHGLQVLNGIFQLVSESRPLFYFGLVGAFITLCGVIGWWWTLSQYAETNQFAFGYGLVSALITIIGVIFIFQGITLNTLRKVMEKQSPRLDPQFSGTSYPQHLAPTLISQNNQVTIANEQDSTGSLSHIEEPETTVSFSIQPPRPTEAAHRSKNQDVSAHSARKKLDESRRPIEKEYNTEPFSSGTLGAAP